MAARPLPQILGCAVVALSVGACAGPAAYASARGASAPVAPVESVPITEFAGSWEGIYYSYPHPMGLVLTLTQMGGTRVEGEIRLYPLAETRSAVRPPEGRFSVQGTYDPVLRTFDLSPGGWLDRPRQGGTPFALAGVFDPGQPALAGLFAGRGDAYFTLTHPDRADALRRSMLEAAGEASRQRGGRAPDDATLVRWASRLSGEHPDINPRRTPMGRLLSLATNLFEDEYFRAHFGRTFDELSPGQREAVHARLASTTRLSTARPGTVAALTQRRPNEELREFSGLRSAFSTTGTQSAADVVHRVLAQRVIRAWRAGQLARLAATPPSADAFEQLERLDVVARTHLRTLWPTEQDGFAQAIAQDRARLAVPVLTAAVDALIATEPSRDGAAALAGWQHGRDALLAAVPADMRAALGARVDARLDVVLDRLMAAELAALDGLGTGIAAVEAGNQWLAGVRGRYDFALGRAPVRAALARLEGRRDADLRAGHAEIAARIATQNAADRIDALVGRLLAVPGDAQRAGGRAITELATNRKAALRQAALNLVIVTPAGHRSYVDTSTLSGGAGGRVAGWTTLDYGTPFVDRRVSGRAIARAVERQEFDCQAYQSRRTAVRYYDAQGEQLAAVTLPAVAASWFWVAPQTIGEAQLEAACAYQRENRRLPPLRPGPDDRHRWEQAVGTQSIRFDVDAGQIRWVRLRDGTAVLRSWTRLSFDWAQRHEDSGDEYNEARELWEVNCAAGRDGYPYRQLAYILYRDGSGSGSGSGGSPVASVDQVGAISPAWKRSVPGEIMHGFISRLCTMGRAQAQGSG